MQIEISPKNLVKLSLAIILLIGLSFETAFSYTSSDIMALKQKHKEYAAASEQILALESEYQETTHLLNNAARKEQEAINLLDSDTQRRHANDRDIRSYQADIHNLERQNQQLEINRRELESRKSNLDTRVAVEKQRLQPLNQRLQLEKRKLAELRAKQVEVDKLVTHMLHYERTHLAELNKNKQTLVNLNRSIPNLESSIANSQQAIKKEEQKQNNLKQQLVERNKQLASAKEKLNNVPRNERPQQQREILAIEKEITHLHHIIAISTNEERKQRSQLQQSQNILAQIKPQQKELENKIAEAERKTPQIKRRQAEIQADKNQIEKDLALQERNTSNTQNEYNQASASLRQLETQQQSLQGRLQEAQASIRDNQQNIARSQTRIQAKVDENRNLDRRRPQLEANLRDLQRDLHRLQRQHQVVAERLQRVQNNLDFPVVSTHNGNLVHIIVSQVEVSRDTEYAMQRALDSGQKIMLWFTVELNYPSAYLRQISGLRNVYSSHESSHLVGEGPLNGIYVPSSRVFLEMNQNTVALLANGYGRLAMAANLISSSYSRESIVLSTSVNPSDIQSYDLQQILDRIYRASIEDIFGDLQPLPNQITFSEHNLNLAIPDNNSSGVSLDIPLSADYGARVNSMRLNVEIRHTYIGDLEVLLISPSGRVLSLHKRSGGSQDDLNLKLEDKDLRDMQGELVNGLWQLKVIDHVRQDVGYISSVHLSVGI